MKESHKELKKKARRWLEEKGYSVHEEVSIGGRRVDVLGIKLDPPDMVGVECGEITNKTPPPENIAIFHWPYESSEPYHWEPSISRNPRKSVRMSLRVPIEIKRALRKVLDNRHKLNLPYTTEADIVRDALVHRLDWLQRLNTPIESNLARLTAIENLLWEEKYQRHFVELLDNLEERVGWLLSQGDEASKQHAQELVQKTYKQVCTMEGFWYEHALQTLRTKFGHLLEPWDISRMEEQ